MTRPDPVLDLRMRRLLITAVGLAACTAVALSLPTPAAGDEGRGGPERPTADGGEAGGAPADPLFSTLRRAAPRLDQEVLRLALDATRCARHRGEAVRRSVLAVIDYSLPSTKERLWVFDLDRRRLLHRELVAHGEGSGANYARAFSNREGSHQSSLGLFLTADTYHGRNGYSLRLHGVEKGINDLALPRTIVMHGAWYVTRAFAAEHGRLGRSWGCPALRPGAARRVIDTIKGGSALFVYHPDLVAASPLLAACSPAPAPEDSGVVTSAAAR